VLEEELKINPGDLYALATLARSYTSGAQRATAIQKVSEYASLAPKSAAVQQYLGNLLLASGDQARARAAFAASHHADPKFIPAYLSLAQVDVADRKPEEARKRLKAVIELDGRNSTALLWLGNIEENSGNHQAALAYYRQVLDIDASNTQALNNAAYILAEYANQPDEAHKYAQKAKELAPDADAVEDTLGWILYRKGLYSVALPHLERAVSQKGSASARYHLAMAYARAGNLERGRATMQAALKANPNAPEAKMAKEVLDHTK